MFCFSVVSTRNGEMDDLPDFQRGQIVGGHIAEALYSKQKGNNLVVSKVV